MRVPGTSFSLSPGGGSSAVCRFLMRCIELWYFWNYFRRYSYLELCRWQYLLVGHVRPGCAADEKLPLGGLDTRHISSIGIATPGTRWHATAPIAASAGVISVANEANDVANDVASDVASEKSRTRQRRARRNALERLVQGCRHLNTALHGDWSTIMIVPEQD
jgi:hypothetical protein